MYYSLDMLSANELFANIPGNIHEADVSSFFHRVDLTLNNKTPHAGALHDLDHSLRLKPLGRRGGIQMMQTARLLEQLERPLPVDNCS
jgi:hypothetical protein